MTLDNNSLLISAAGRGSLDEVRELLDRKGANIEAKDNYDKTPLHFAAFGSHLEVATFLIEKGANIEAKDNSGRTPLHWAAFGGNLEVATFLIEKGANIEAKDNYSETPLHFAADRGHLELATFLIAKGANIEAKDNYSKTPLHWAASSGHLEVATFLIEKGANISVRNVMYQSPSDLAEANGKVEMVNFLRDKQNKYDQSLLYNAYYGDSSKIIGLLDKGANIEAKGVANETPLCIAASRGNLGIIELLLSRRANVNVQDSNERTPLHHAAYTGQGVDLILGKNPNIEAKDTSGWTPLHWAAWYGQLNAAKALVDKGATIEVKGKNNKTPLELANDNGKTEVANFLSGKVMTVFQAQRKRRHYHGDHPRHHDREQRYLQEEERFMHLEPEGAGHSIGNVNSAIESNQATSGASKPSSLIDAFANTIVDAVKGVSYFISSPFKPAIDMEHSQSSKAMTTQSIDTNGTLLLLDVFIKKVTGQKYISTADQPVSLLEARGYALNITTEFERVLKDTAKRSGVSASKSGFDSLEIYKAIEGKMISGELSKIPTILYVAVKEAYPKSEKFLGILEGNIKKMLDEQQMVNNRNSSNQTQSITSTNNKMPLSLLNNAAIEPANSKKRITSISYSLSYNSPNAIRYVFMAIAGQ